MITELQPNIRHPELYEVLELIDQAKTNEEVVTLIKKFGGKYSWFTDYLRCVFDEGIQFLLPPGIPPYTPAHEAHYPTSWHRKHMDLGNWVKGMRGEQINAIKRESGFITMLETIHPEDAVHIVNMTQKKTSVAGLTKELVKEALPELAGF
jgi:hypothetical protein